MLTFKKGFTLIELLVVIGVLAVLMAGVVALINPVEKNRQALDARVFNDIGQMSTAVQTIAATQSDGAYPCLTAAAGCINPTVSMLAYLGNGANASSELQAVPTAPNGGAAPFSAYLYFAPAGTRPTAFELYGKLGSNKYNSQCSAAMGGTQSWYVFDSAVGHSCIECRNAAPAAYAAVTCDINL
jgi:prepilin-type N-terminal cleavage/methylation domain-containing protein